MSGGSPAPPNTSPLLGLRPRAPLERFAFRSPFESSLGGRAPAPPHPPGLLGLRPRVPLERLVIIVVIMDDGVGVYMNDDYSD